MVADARIPRLRESLLPLAPVIAAGLFVFLFIVYYRALDIGGDSQSIFSNSHSIDHIRGKLLFGVSLLGLTIALLWNLGISIIIVCRRFLTFPGRKTVTLWISIIAVNVLVWLFLLNFDVGGAAAEGFLVEIEMSGIPIKKITMFNNLFAASTIIMVVVSLWALATPPGINDVRALGDRIHAFTLSIYSTAALLGFGIFEVYSLFSWAALLSTKVDRGAIMGLANTLAVAAGIIFSTMMVILYLPIAIIQHGWLKAKYTDNGKADQTFDEWLSKHGLPSSPLNILGSYLAILLPFGVGIVTKALGA